MREGYSSELDKWQAILRHDPKSPEKQELQAKYRELVGSTRLRVVYQAEKGYFLDIPHDENAKLLKTDRGRRELEKLTLFQSLKNSVRYRSEELRQLNRELTEAAVEVDRVEGDIFTSLRDRVLLVRDELQSMAHAISQIDVVCSHAQVALDRNFTRPCWMAAVSCTLKMAGMPWWKLRTCVVQTLRVCEHLCPIVCIWQQHPSALAGC